MRLAINHENKTTVIPARLFTHTLNLEILNFVSALMPLYFTDFFFFINISSQLSNPLNRVSRYLHSLTRTRAYSQSYHKKYHKTNLYTYICFCSFQNVHISFIYDVKYTYING